MKTIFVSPQGKIKKFKNLVVAIGIFDGVHRGHQRLIAKTITQARNIKGTSGVLTFFPHPVQVLNKRFDLSLLVSLPHRLRLIEKLGVDVCFIVTFTNKFAAITAEDFVKGYLFDRLGAREVFIGRNFHFGKGRDGNSQTMTMAARKHSIKVHAIEPVCDRQKTISSSLLRNLIKEGEISAAQRYLGRPISVFGQVIHGDHRGRRFRTPTANIDAGPEILLPAGVYVANVLIGAKTFRGVANIGFCPTFTKEKERKVEVHILDFSKDIYGQFIELYFLKKIRNEKRFLSKEHLCEQIEKDKEEARQYFLKKIL